MILTVGHLKSLGAAKLAFIAFRRLWVHQLVTCAGRLNLPCFRTVRALISLLSSTLPSSVIFLFLSLSLSLCLPASLLICLCSEAGEISGILLFEVLGGQRPRCVARGRQQADAETCRSPDARTRCDLLHRADRPHDFESTTGCHPKPHSSWPSRGAGEGGAGPSVVFPPLKGPRGIRVALPLLAGRKQQVSQQGRQGTQSRPLASWDDALCVQALLSNRLVWDRLPFSCTR